MILNKRPSLPLLQAELAAAGIVVNGLGCYGLTEDVTEVNVHTYDTSGTEIDLPPEAAPILAAHTLPEPETPPTEILLGLLADVTDVDETKPIIEAMLLILGGQT